MEKLPKLTLSRGGLRVHGFKSRKKLHEDSCPWYHPTALVLVVKPDGRAVLVDKYWKDYWKALWAGHPLSGQYRKLDAFGGHIKMEALLERDDPFLSYETFLEAALEELEEECRIDDGQNRRLPVDRSRLSYLGFSVWHEDGNRECSAYFRYDLADDLPLVGCDDGYDQDGVLRTIPLDTVQIPYFQLLKDYLLAAPDPALDPAEGYADGLARLLRSADANVPVPAFSAEASKKYLGDVQKVTVGKPD